MKHLTRLFLLVSVTNLAQSADAPLLKVLNLFTTPAVPAHGSQESPPKHAWDLPQDEPPARPGRGLAQHPMLYAGEGHNVLYLVNDGRVIWKYEAGDKGEIDDVWLMTNGHILYTRQNYVEEITPQKEVVWHYDAPAGNEIHTCQPVGLDRVLFVQNGLPPKAIIVEKATGKRIVEHDLPAESTTDPKTVHPQFRRIRLTAAGTYLLSFLKLHRVVEYDREFNEIWRYDIPTAWAAMRLKNGNTLIVDERERLVREVNPAKETVWEFKQTDLPPGIAFRNIQTCERLANGNTIIFSSLGGAKTSEEKTASIQCVEVTRDKRVVWALQDWKNLGPATTAQFLDQPGVPEKPGDAQR
jgi:outer membrane protein assembly factor BamB